MTSPHAFPLRLTGELDPDVGRWQWLFKWLLAIPHYVVLFFLYIGAFLAVIGAWFAILFTGRYPRGIFDFVQGVIRWHNRVIVYPLILVTERYPPFSLSSQPESSTAVSRHDPACRWRPTASTDNETPHGPLPICGAEILR